MIENAEFWVTIAFAMFIGLLAWLGVFRKLLVALDERGGRIKSDLEEARRLREEAQQLVKHYQRRRLEAEDEAQAIIAAAKTEAERLAQEAKQKSEDFIVRRTKMAETKIAQAEAQAVAEVRAAAADAAVKAAGEVLKKSAKGKIGEELVQKGLKEVRDKLH
jgi:F-type H+-transporting ATPase subunit b